MAKSPKPSASPEVVSAYKRLVATIPGLEPKGATMPYTSVNGNMTSYLDKSGRVALRLPADMRDAFLKKYKTTLFANYGVIQKEYVEVPSALLGKTAELKPYFAAGYSYVEGLRPKPTTKKKKKA
jgi:hypothetical protein